MKIFFTGSPRALRFPAYKKDLQSIFNSLSRHGENLSRLVIEAVPDEFYRLDYEGVVKHYQTTINHLKDADVVVAEVSMQSMSMGFLVNMSLGMSKPTLCLYANGKSPFFLSGINSLNLIISEYKSDTIEQVISEAFEYFSGNKDKRFNLMLPPSMANFLNQEAERKNTTKADLIRSAIAQMMKE